MPAYGFFPHETASKKPQFNSMQCAACGLKRTCKTPVMPLDGEGKKEILIIAEAPGATEDDRGIPLCGKTGQHLERTLREFDIDMRRDCWLTNALLCRPPGNATPTDKQIAWCRPHLTSKIDNRGDIHRIKPKTIILLGGAAVKAVIGWLWKEDAGGVNRWVGWRIPDQQTNAWICPAWHPSFVVREDKNKVVELMWKRHLEAAVSLRGRPWKTVPDWASQVNVEMTARQAAQYIRAIINMNKPTAWDIETTTLKPDGPHVEIVSCALSNGMVTVSYPWHGEARKASLEFITSKVPKIGYNCKFETRYLWAVEGVNVCNWVWDGMLASHILDNRPDSKSLKYQAFCLLGQTSYDDAIKPYLQAPTTNSKNRIKDLSLRDLLVYGGLDAILEYKVAMRQAKKAGIDLV